MIPFVSQAPRPYRKFSSSRIGIVAGGTVSRCVQNITRPSPAYAKTLKRSPVTFWRSTRYPSELRWAERNSPISLSLPVTDGIDINRLVSSNGFISTFQSGGNSLAGELTLVTQKMYDTVPIRFCEFDLIVFNHFGLQKDPPDFAQ